MNNYSSIINRLPYSDPFLFVDDIISLDENGIEGIYTFKENESFYAGHFKDHPITPGVILTECMAQIGLVCLGLHLLEQETGQIASVAMSSTEIDFLLPVYPMDKVTVISEKLYFRFNKLKCKVKMLNEEAVVVCRGTISGMILKRN